MKRLLALLFILSFAVAADVAVGTYVMNIGDYDISRGTYDADFYLWFKGESIPSSFEFMNGEVTSIDTIINESNYSFYRVRARLSTPPQFADYPSDKQTISIIVEDSLNTIEDVRYVVDSEETGVHSTLNILGWELTNSSVGVSESVYENWGETYSRYEHSVVIARPGSSLFKIIFPVFFIALVAWLGFFVPKKQFETRAALGFSAVLSAVAFHLTVTSSIPPVGFLTLADKFMIALYSFVVFVVAALVLVERFRNKDKNKKARQVNRVSILVSVVVPFVVFALLSLL